MDNILELSELAPDPVEEWQRMLHFSGLSGDDRRHMARSVESLMQRGTEMVVNTYDYLKSIPETAAILGWEESVDPQHLEERRRFFTIWLARTLGIDTSDEFASYLFRAGQYHAGLGPRKIHIPPAYVTTSIGIVLSSFSRYMLEANLPAETIALAMAGWSKFLSVQLNQMHHGYSIAQEYSRGEYDVRISVFGRLRPLIGYPELVIPINNGAKVNDLLKKLFDFYPQTRPVALERVWHSYESDESRWVEVKPVYVPRKGWRILLNGRDLGFEYDFNVPVQEKDELAIFPPGR